MKKTTKHNLKKTYWQNLKQFQSNPSNEELATTEKDSDLDHSRRDFLKMMGFGIATASIAACETPIRKAIPYVNKPFDINPSIPNYYASTYMDGGNYCSIVVKTREGRPIKIEGNPLSKITQGGMNSQAEASVMSLYDDYRLRGPKQQNSQTAATWGEIDKKIINQLQEISSKGGQIRLVSNTILSPSTQMVIDKFKLKYPTTQHIEYDPVSYYGISQANKESFGKAFIPLYDFSKAQRIVSIGADFLGTWLSPIMFSSHYAINRKVTKKQRKMSRHYQFESILSMTGANADYRTMIRPSQEGAVVTQLYNLLAKKAGRSPIQIEGNTMTNLSKIAEDLWTHRKESLVVSGSNNKSIQLLVNGINDMLESYGNTISTKILKHLQGDDRAMDTFMSDVQEKNVSAIVFYNCNPVYDYPMGEKLAQALKEIPLTISTSYTENETSALVQYKTPDHHYLESWNDFEPLSNSYSLSQPVITPLFQTRQAQTSLMMWAEDKQDYFSFVKNNWKNWFRLQWDGKMTFQHFWDKCLYDGVFEDKPSSEQEVLFSNNTDVHSALIHLDKISNTSDFEVVIYESYTLGTGSQANNPLLQELPDPITKTVWSHCATISQKDAIRLAIENDADGNTQYINITTHDKTITIPALVQPGQAPGTIGIPLGYGRTKVGKVAKNLGLNVYPLISSVKGIRHYHIISDVAVKKHDKAYQIAQTQTHSTYMGRHSVIQEASLSEFKHNPYAGREFPKITKWDKKVEPNTLSLWKGHEYKDHHWGMAIDLNSCTGCGTCIVACNIENNVAVVGKDEVIQRREMHWMRIDRYYSSITTDMSDHKKLEEAAENPEVIFQPMLCQHCNNAPCETVCPVAATTHSTEGLNQMTYNRCIGTRYCANNCPYKVRRFNWFKYHNNKQFAQVNPSMNTDLGRMILNPDVTVRSRGVMEKCSFCVQRIQEGKLKAKKEKRPLEDEDVITACQASCTSGAIIFGDMNNPKSQITKLLQIKLNKNKPYSPDKHIGNPRAYRVLEEIGVKPNIFYLTKIKNKDDEQVHI